MCLCVCVWCVCVRACVLSSTVTFILAIGNYLVSLFILTHLKKSYVLVCIHMLKHLLTSKILYIISHLFSPITQCDTEALATLRMMEPAEEIQIAEWM